MSFPHSFYTYAKPIFWICLLVLLFFIHYLIYFLQLRKDRRYAGSELVLIKWKDESYKDILDWTYFRQDKKGRLKLEGYHDSSNKNRRPYPKNIECVTSIVPKSGISIVETSITSTKTLFLDEETYIPLETNILFFNKDVFEEELGFSIIDYNLDPTIVDKNNANLINKYKCHPLYGTTGYIKFEDCEIVTKSIKDWLRISNVSNLVRKNIDNLI